MDAKSFGTINKSLEDGVYRVNDSRGVLETGCGFPVLWNGYSIEICDNTHGISTADLKQARKTLADFQAFINKGEHKPEGVQERRSAGKHAEPMGKDETEALFNQWVAESEAYLKDKYHRTQAVQGEILAEIASYRGAFGEILKQETSVLARYRRADKECFKVEAGYEAQVKANQTIRQLFMQLDCQQFSNEREVRSAINRVAADYHRQQQDRLLTEVIQLSELLVKEADGPDKALVFPGRSLIACAAYIEEKYPDIPVIKIPLSRVGSYTTLSRNGLSSDHSSPVARALSPDEIREVREELSNGEEIPARIKNRIFKAEFQDGVSFNYSAGEVKEACRVYLDSYLAGFKGHTLILADYIVSGGGLENFAAMVTDYRRRRYGIKTVAVLGTSVRNDRNELAELQQQMTRSGFDMGAGCFTADGVLADSLLVRLLTGSGFDGFSPYGKHTVENIVRGVAVTGNEPDDFGGFQEIGQQAALLSESSVHDDQSIWKWV